MPKQAKVAIPVALAGALVAVIIWLSSAALRTENRLTCVEVESKTQDRTLVEIKDDLKEVKHDIKALLRRGPN